MPEDNDILRFFDYEDLPENLQAVSRPFNDLAYEMMAIDGLDPEEALAGMRKLLEAKDCFVRAALDTQE